MHMTGTEDKFKEECGVFGIFSSNTMELEAIYYEALNSLQHRGEESCGIAFSDGTSISCIKSMGLFCDLYNSGKINNVKGTGSIGHVRYSTFGESNILNAQPILSKNTSVHMAIAHNGNIVNANILKDQLVKEGISFSTTTDSEVILKLIEKETEKGIEEAIIDAMKKIQGAYALTILTKDKLIGVRDPNGIRPLCIGKRKNDYVLSSESCALDAVGAEFIRDVYPGEIVVIDKEGISSLSYGRKNSCATCAFEYIYFAREDSVIDGIDVYKSRVLAGEQLYKENFVSADVVIGVPNSGIPAALGYSKASKIPYEIGFVKNAYVGRTFITPSKEIRERYLDIKLSVIKSNIEGKRVIVVDDSIVRGTTSKKIVKLLRDAGAKEVHFMAASPIVKYPCFFGINTPYSSELLGASKSIEEIREFLQADSVGYLSIEGLLKALGENKKVCLNCFISEKEYINGFEGLSHNVIKLKCKYYTFENCSNC